MKMTKEYYTFGTVTYKGKTLHLDREPELSGNINNDTYTAYAVDLEEEEWESRYLVTWQITDEYLECERKARERSNRDHERSNRDHDNAHNWQEDGEDEYGEDEYGEDECGAELDCSDESWACDWDEYTIEQLY